MEGTAKRPPLFFLSPTDNAQMNSFYSSDAPFSPMDTREVQSSTTTPRRRLSLEVDENAQLHLEDAGYGDSQGSCSSLSTNESSMECERSPLCEIKPVNNNTMPANRRRTVLARRLKRNISTPVISEEHKENTPNPIKIPHAVPIFHRPTSLPTFSDSFSPTQHDTMVKRHSLLGQIKSPMERMSLTSPTTTHPLHPSHRPASTTSNTESDGYFSEVFENDELEDAIPDTISSLIHAPLTNSPMVSTFVNKSGNKSGLVCPTPVRPTASAYQYTTREQLFSNRRGSLKRSSPCSDTSHLQRCKRPPLPVFSSISNCSPPQRPLKGVPLLRSQSCSVPQTETGSPVSPENDYRDFIGDFSKPCALPLVTGKIPDLKCITPETLSKLLQGEYSTSVDEYTIVDCRYPYEYDGGHIQGAINIWEKDSLLEMFFKAPKHPTDDKRSIVVFHCEFSSKRGPDMSRFMRKMDREKNGMDFPKLYYPEMYLLEKGYKVFYENHPDLCQPNGYCTMLDESHTDALKHFKQRSKSWNGESNSKRRGQPLLRHRRSTAYDSSSAFSSRNN